MLYMLSSFLLFTSYRVNYRGKLFEIPINKQTNGVTWNHFDIKPDIRGHMMYHIKESRETIHKKQLSETTYVSNKLIGYYYKLV
jgi:hypothetical protein